MGVWGLSVSCKFDAGGGGGELQRERGGGGGGVINFQVKR